MILAYCCSLWFVYFLLNYAEITSRPASWLKRVLGRVHLQLAYPLSCPFCLGFHISWMLYLIDWAPGLWILIAPVGHLFIDLAYRKLAIDKVPYIEWRSRELEKELP